jgi:hypothetical protein
MLMHNAHALQCVGVMSISAYQSSPSGGCSVVRQCG